jgi:hypothetical protein
VQEAARQFKANLKLQGQPCGVCANPFALGEDVSACTQCESHQHTACWEQHGGCSTQGCVNAALKKLDEPAAAAPKAALPPGAKRCPSCNMQISETDQICLYCKAIVTPDGMYHGPKQTAPGATASLVYGIISLLICGLIFGPLAIIKANEAQKIIAEDPRYGGGGMATAGKVLGIIALIFWAVGLIVRIGGAVE